MKVQNIYTYNLNQNQNNLYEKSKFSKNYYVSFILISAIKRAGKQTVCLNATIYKANNLFFLECVTNSHNIPKCIKILK